MKTGSKPGFFVPSDSPWVVHADFGTLVGGIRALLMQALHPGTLRGVTQHSRYEQDPLGRLSGTIRWLTITTFGSQEAIEQEASRVNRLHKSVTGTYTDNQNSDTTYRAADPDLMMWVHVAFTESFIVSHLTYSDTAVPGGIDRYVQQWAVAAEPLGLTEGVPKSESELDARINWYYESGLLRCDHETRKVIGFIKNPPLPALAKPIYALLFQAAVASLKPEFREMLGLRCWPEWLVVALTKNTLKLMRLAVGPDSPIEEAARERIAKLSQN
jgi:uncharacterized protein (DUF2236 family)